jgi:predicted Zn-ribbon and HTH transcriptional regulator
MIQVRLSELILILMIPGMLSLIYFWLRSVLKERRQDRVMRSAMLRCRICGYPFVPMVTEGEITHCPSCKSANLNKPSRII